MCRIVTALTLVCFGSLILTFRQDDYIIKHNFAEVNYYNKNALEYLTVKNVKPNRTYRAYSIFGHILVDLDGDTFKGNIKAFRFVNNLYHHKIVDYDVKICHMLETNYLGIADRLKTSNITRCPVRKGYYALYNFNVDDHQLPPFIPAGRYRVQLSLLHGGYTIIRSSIYAEVVYKTNKN